MLFTSECYVPLLSKVPLFVSEVPKLCWELTMGPWNVVTIPRTDHRDTDLRQSGLVKWRRNLKDSAGSSLHDPTVLVILPEL